MRTLLHNGGGITAATYAKPLLSLNEDMRVEIMHILLNSISHSEASGGEKEYDLYTCFKGSWGEGTDVEEYVEDLREGISEPKEVDIW